MNTKITYLLLLLAPLALLLAGCGTQPLDDIVTPQDVIDAKNPTDTAPDTETLMAGIEPEVQITVETKTSYDSVKGKFIWSVGDQIALYYSDGNFHTCTITADGKAGYKPVIPPSTTVGLTRMNWAVYPATAAVPGQCSSNNLQVNYPDSYDISDIVNGNGSFEESCCPMVARNYHTKATLDFYHVGGLLRMNMTLLDKNSAFVRFTFDKDVTGTYSVANLDSTAPTVTTQGSASNNVVTVTLNGGESIGYRRYDSPFYINIPVPCGEYNNIKVEILNASNQVQESATIPHTLIFDRHHGRRIAFIEYHDRNLTRAYVPGKFSISDTKTVYFASGNLLVENTLRNGINERVWMFEDAQYKSSGYYHEGSEEHGGGYSIEGVTRKISHFGWATAGVKNANGNYGYDASHVKYEPHSIDDVTPDPNTGHCGYGPNFYFVGQWITWPNKQNIVWAEMSYDDNNPDGGNYFNWHSNSTVRQYCDWGVHFDDKGVGHENLSEIPGGIGSWNTPNAGNSNGGMMYLSKRTDKNVGYEYGHISCGLIHDKDTGEEIAGVILLPDVWATPSGCTLGVLDNQDQLLDYSLYQNNKYTSLANASPSQYPGGRWSDMEKAGAVFLPEVGSRISYTATPNLWTFERRRTSYFAEEQSWTPYMCSQFNGSQFNGTDGMYFAVCFDLSMAFYNGGCPVVLSFRPNGRAVPRCGYPVRLIHDTNVNL